MSAVSHRVDVAVVGAGLVGLSAALACHQAGYTVALVDAGPALTTASADASLQWDARIYAISPSNAQWLAKLGVWPLLDKARIGQINSMQLFADAVPLNMTPDEAAGPMAYVVEAGQLLQALYKAIQATGMPLLFDSPCAAVNSSSNITHLCLVDKRIIESRLLVAADGSQSWLRQQLQISVQEKSYEQRAIVANFSVEKPHADIARQWFASEPTLGSYILAWLPLPNNTLSIVWSVPLAHAEQLLNLSAAEFSLAVVQAGGHALGEMHLLSAPKAFPLRLQLSEKTVQDGVVFVGDAAHQIHPMAGQGVNLGFRDVIDLMQSLQEKNAYQGLADSGLLKAYTRRRKVDVLSMRVITDGLFQVFASKYAVIKGIRSAAWSAANASLIKKTLLAFALKI
ncbi:MAG: FAD-dependent oxidoreductase [Methylotenera sp.]|nr:FAD-dependent oxidoreductase [Methylotenera sp.]